MRTKFGKSVSIDNPYATFNNDRMNMEWRVLKTYQGFDKEKGHGVVLGQVRFLSD